MRCKEKSMLCPFREKERPAHARSIRFPVQSRSERPGRATVSARQSAASPYSPTMDHESGHWLPNLCAIFSRQKTPGRTTQHRLLKCRQGQALYEYILAFPVFALLLIFVGAFSWYWWNQSVAAVAIHDGVRAAAVYEGAKSTGLAVVKDRLYAPLGANAAALYDGRYNIGTHSLSRSVYGYIDAYKSFRIPFLGRHTLFHVRAFSYQRDWAFYGKPTHGWD